MSVKYTPVQWNNNKWLYDAVLIACAATYLLLFIRYIPPALRFPQPITPDIHNARAFGSCAFLMLSVILAIGPLARLDRRFLPLLYNRRHFGVLTAFVAVTHASFIINWYFAFSPTPNLEALLSSNTSFGQVRGFPFEAFGIFTLIVLFILAATSHDFWLKFLTPRVWKALHMLIYPAYASVVAHVALGGLQSRENLLMAWIVGLAAATVSGLHIAAGLREWQNGDPAGDGDAWHEVCRIDEIRDGYAKMARLPNGERVAVFRQDGTLSAVSNACAHQNGPLGEGRIVGGFITCPWHGFQHRAVDGCSPAPFTEKIPTYRVRIKDGVVSVHGCANPPGTYVEPTAVREG